MDTKNRSNHQGISNTEIIRYCWMLYRDIIELKKRLESK